MSLTYIPEGICAAQFYRLDCTGNILLGAGNLWQGCNALDIEMSVDSEDPITKTVVVANGTSCISRAIPGRETSRSYKINLCPRIDVDLMQLLGIYDLVLDATNDALGIQSRGLASGCVSCGSTSCAGAVGMVVFSNNVDPSSRSTWPYVVQMVPFAQFTITSSRTWKAPREDFDPIEVTATLSPNLAWGRGPNDLFPDLGGLSTEWAEFVTTATPPQGCNCHTGGFATAVTDYSTLQPDNPGDARILGSTGKWLMTQRDYRGPAVSVPFDMSRAISV